jgi:ATP-dependent DNA helicase RecG
MAPTEILAEQHYRTLQAILAAGGADYRVACLTGSRRAAARRAILAGVEAGVTQVVVGTHALFERGVRFARLGLAVVDEQHRFGVLQRAALAGKGARPDVLVMSATPIPRSLALTAYGDLDLSVLDARPPGRRPVRTVVRGEADRERVYRGVRAAVAAGRQAYVVVPLVEETAASDLKAATAFARDLAAGALAGIKVGLVHGRMRPEAKDAVMRDFGAGAVAVLVATTVVEVGVDVPNATVMVIEHAERFGLSQLHQLRGRVGRGRLRSYCVLLVGGDGPGEAARRRLEILEHTDDGFLVAERDLEIRGPGAVFGTQQHGLSDLQFLARILRDPALLDAARAEAWSIVEAGEAGAARAQAILDGLRGPWRRRLRLAGVV